MDDILRETPECDVQSIAEAFKVTPKTVWYRRKALWERITTGVDMRMPPGFASAVLPEYKEFALELLTWDPTLYLDEIADHLYAEFGEKALFSTTTIWRMWKEAKISHKKNEVSASQQDPVLVEDFSFKQQQLDATRIGVLDESSFSERTGDRRWGWAPLGVPPRVKRMLQKSERWSLLPAYTIDGFLEPMIKHGSILQTDFEDWLINRLLPQCNRWPGDRDILIMDNCSTHKSQNVIDACNDHGVTLIFLPPYTPRFNPIEAAFHDLKAYIRRHYRVQEFGYDAFAPFLNDAVQRHGRDSAAAKRARGHFRHAGYVGVPED